MATLKQRLHRKNGSAYDIIHMETESNVVLRPSGNTVETDLTNYLPKVQNSDDVPQGLTPGQISIGVSKGYYCTGDGEVREFGKGGGGVPVYGKDFTYTGDYQIIDDGDGNWRVKFLTSGTFIPLNDMTVDIFLVGGGGSGGLSMGGLSTNYLAAGTGGGGGYTTTVKLLVLTANTEYPITIGDGGVGPTAINDRSESDGTNGGSSSAFGETSNGGYGGKKRGNASYATRYRGGNGGSGGGGCDKSRGYNGGSDGSDGSCGSYDTKGIGQGTTTREFGEETGDLYAGGGGAGAGSTSNLPGAGGEGGGGSGCACGTILSTTSVNPSINGEENTGGGGGGNHITQVSGGLSWNYLSSGSGGSGIIIIRNHRE